LLEEFLLEGFELREEIRYGGSSYFLQTSFNPESEQVTSSFFRDGAVFDTMVRKAGGDSEPEELRELTKKVHQQNKRSFRFILDARDNIARSDDPNPHLRLAKVLLRRNLFREAISEAETAVEKGANDSRAWMVIGESFYMMDELDMALDAIRKGIELSPDYPDLHNLIGKIFLRQNMCGLAVESFKKAISLNMYYGEPYLNLIRTYLTNTIIKQDYELSRGLGDKFGTNIEKAKQLNPNMRDGILDDVKAHFEKEEYEQALKLLEGIGPTSARSLVDDIILELYLILVQSEDEIEEGDIGKYLDRVNDILDRNPTFADAWNTLGILYTAKCKLFMDMAGEAFEKALEINGDYEKARKNLRLTENDRQGIFILLKALLD
jgi:tetratricopeptide (TPR) repeat protein